MKTTDPMKVSPLVTRAPSSVYAPGAGDELRTGPDDLAGQLELYQYVGSTGFQQARGQLVRGNGAASQARRVAPPPAADAQVPSNAISLSGQVASTAGTGLPLIAPPLPLG